MVLLATAAFAVPSVGLGQGPQNDDLGRAEFMHGAAAYDVGNYEVALESFQRALELTGRPQLHYNVALAHDRLRHDEQALESYETYLRLNPDAPHRVTVESRIEALRGALSERNALREAERQALEEERLRLEQERQAAEDARRLAEARTEDEGDDNLAWWIGGIAGGVAAVATTVVLVVVLTDQDVEYDEGDFGPVTFAASGASGGRSRSSAVTVARW